MLSERVTSKGRRQFLGTWDADRKMCGRPRKTASMADDVHINRFPKNREIGSDCGNGGVFDKVGGRDFEQCRQMIARQLRQREGQR